MFLHPLETCLQWPTHMIVAFLNAYKPMVDKMMEPPQDDADTDGSDTAGTGTPG